MTHKYWTSAVQYALILAGIAALVLVSNCGDTKQQDISAQDPSAVSDKPGRFPKKAIFGQYYKDPTTGRKWIFDGANWVPRDNTVDDYYQQLDAAKSKILMSMTQDAVRTAPCTTADGTGAHPKHAGFNCKVCHMVGGVMCFDPAGPATGTGTPPSFNATAKTCSNIKCHGVPAGTFSYYFPGNETDEDGYPIPELKTVHYGGTMAASTPAWYATGAGCAACHGNPPAHGSDGSNAWHSSNHANNQNVGPIGPNACELCHNQFIPTSTFNPIAHSSGSGSGVYGDAILIPALHANGTADVVGRFRTQCFNCH